MLPVADVEVDVRGSLGTVRNAVALLHLLAEGPAHHQLTDLADRSGLSLPTVHRLLRSLSLAGIVEQDSRSARYGLGPELVRLSQRYLGRLPVLAAVSPYLMPVRDTLGSAVHVVLLTRGWASYVDRAEATDDSLYREPYRVAPALRTAAGRVLAAWADDPGWELALAKVTEQERDEAIPRRASWREAGYLTLPSTDSDMIEVAVPIFDDSQGAVASLVTSVPETRIADAVAHLVKVAQAAGRTLGHG